jgi:hypothetical protein
MSSTEASGAGKKQAVLAQYYEFAVLFEYDPVSLDNGFRNFETQ